MAAVAGGGGGGGLDLERLLADLLAGRADVRDITYDNIARILLPIFQQMESFGAVNEAEACQAFNAKEHEIRQVINALRIYPVDHLKALRSADASLEDGSKAFQTVKAVLDSIVRASLYDLEGLGQDLDTNRDKALSKIRAVPDRDKESFLSPLIQCALESRSDELFILLVNELPDGASKNEFIAMHQSNNERKAARPAASDAAASDKAAGQ